MNQKLTQLIDEVGKVIIGQDDMKRDILISLLCEGHILLEGAPGLAKTHTVKTFAQTMNMDFKRIQFTPDLLPSDILGARIYDIEKKEFQIKKGPIFGNLILADEINRAPSKVQSALLEVMEERQVTLGEETFQLAPPFMVLATQNPLEQEGTFHLPEAQLDRFLLKTLIEYPTKDQEKSILQNFITRNHHTPQEILSSREVVGLQKELEAIDISESIYDYIGDIIQASRNQESYPELRFGGSPRASIALMRTSKALAFLYGRDFVIPEDIKEMAYPVLRHRLILTYEAQAQGMDTDDIIRKILSDVTVS